MKKTILSVSVFVVALQFANADVKLPAIFSEHMVLQQETAVPIWGWADPGEQVTVELAGQVKTTTADTNGKWMLKLAKLKASEGQSLVVKGKNKLTINDVLVGDVWICSGQSNMGLTVNRAKDFEQEKAAAKFPQLRMFTVERTSMAEPQADCKGRWELTTPENVGFFSAAAYFFGREIHQKLGMPVGLINTSWGGTSIEAWTSMEAQAKLKEYGTISDSWVKATAMPYDEKKALEQYNKQLGAYKENAKKAKADGKTAPRAPVKPVDPRLNQNYPANLYNGMIAPLVPYALKGGIWYQGENNSNKSFANIYGLQLETMIKDWRARWGYDFPFAWVQLPDFRTPQKDAVEPSGWVTVREEMLKSLKIPKTGMAITLGLGEANDIHPKNKQEVGKRLAMWALADVYKQKGVASSGPLPSGDKVKGNEIIISFKHTDGGLKVEGGELKGFAIAGEDKVWKWAQARIEGDKVVVSHPDIKKPAAVRYAWAANPVFSLYNGAGIPATPFRTDDWE
jgi:sialate O-acetylesterase